MLSRRRLLAAAPMLMVPGIDFARARTEQRFVLIVLRGAMDGLAAVAPVGDPHYAAARGPLAQGGPATIGGLFAFHPALAETARMFARGEALAVHAVASPYRDRSHFDGQNVLETGGTAPYAVKDGWLNRLLPMLPGADRAVAVTPVVPPVLRGRIPVESYAPSRLPDPTADLIDRVTLLYRDDDLLHPLWSKAMTARATAAGIGPANGGQLPELAGIAAAFLARADGPRIAVLEADGWDTHSGQSGRLNSQFRQLDGALAGLKAGLGPTWRTTIVLAATEFGRTVRTNGTGGTDHGTAGAAILAGGAVRRGRVLADWPGLAPGRLYQGRDLMPTTDLRAVMLAAAQHLGVDPGEAVRVLFPEARGLIAADVLG